MLLIKASLPIGGRGEADYIDAWKSLLEFNGSTAERDIQRALFAHLYENLNILDGKTNSLIQLNGIVLAAYIFLLSSTSMNIPRTSAGVYILGIAYSAAAVFLCLRVIWVHWSSRSDLSHAEAHMRALIRVRTERTIEFRRAWTLCFVSICAILFLAINDFIEKWHFDISGYVPVLLVFHAFLIYTYDDLVIFIVHRNFLLRMKRVRYALRGNRVRWHVLARAMQTKGRRRRKRAALSAP